MSMRTPINQRIVRPSFTVREADTLTKLLGIGINCIPERKDEFIEIAYKLRASVQTVIEKAFAEEENKNV